MALALIVALLIGTAVVVTPSTKESFRLVKTLVGGWLALASLIAASWALRETGSVSWRALWARPIVRATLPFAVVVLTGALITDHPAHFREAAADFAIGAACLVGWSLTLPVAVLWRALQWTLLTGAIVAVLALDQALGLVGVLDGLGVRAPNARLAITSTLGNPGDVGASLVLPLVVALARLLAADARAPRSPVLLVAIAVMSAGLLATTTLAALAAVAAAAFVLGGTVAFRTIGGRRTMAVASLAILATVLVAGPVRARVGRMADALGRGDVNAVLTGRLDGWRAAAAMTRAHPLTGVGQGGFRAAYADTRLALMDRGVPFFAEQDRVMFATPHNEALSVAAEQGWPGVAALAWALGVVGLAAARIRDRRDRLTAIAGLTALGTLSLAWFPMHVAAVAWPWLVFLAWVDARAAKDHA